MIQDGGGYDRYTVGIVCALPLELRAVVAMLDAKYDELPARRGDDNAYTLGRIGKHDIALVCLGAYGTTRAAVATSNMHRSFPSIQVFLMVGICGGVWREEGKDVRLGDVIVAHPEGNQSGIVRFGAGKEEKQGFKQGAALNKSPTRMLNVISLLQMRLLGERHIIQKHIDKLFQEHPGMSQKQPDMHGSFSRPAAQEDRLFESEYDHEGDGTCDSCDLARLVPREARENQNEVEVWYGLLGSEDRVMKNAKVRDALAAEFNLLGFEMEAAGLMDDFNCTVIRGVCDYSDSHKNKKWQGFAAVAAAAYAKALLEVYQPRRETVQDTHPELGRRSSVVQAFTRAETTRRMSATLDMIDIDGKGTNVSQLDTLKDHRGRLLLKNPLDDLEHVGVPVDGTCEWIQSSETFQQWQSNGPPLLWISGLPGRGKTMISSFLIRKLRDNTHNGDRVLFLFCSDDHELHTDEIFVVKGLLGQVVDDACSSDQLIRRATVFRLFEQHVKTRDYFSSVDALWRTLAAALTDPTLGYKYCIIDGLNECNKSDELLRKIERLVSQAKPQLQGSLPRFIFTSQETPKLRNLSLNGLCKQLDLDDREHHDQLQKDMRTFVFAKLKQELSHVPDFQGELEQELGETLIKFAEGSFIYVDCMIRYLREEYTRAGVRTKIGHIPDGLDDFFKRILLRIKDRTRFATTIQILRFVAIAIRPLTRAEVEGAAKVFSSAARKAGDSSNVIYLDDSVDEFLRQCNPLLIEKDGHIVFFHHTAKRFLRDKALLDPALEQFHMNAIESNLRVAQFCLKYIFRTPIVDKPAQSENDKVFRDWPCLQYAVAYWPEHARRAKEQSRNIIEGIQKDPLLPGPVKSMLEGDDAHSRQSWWQTKIAMQSSHGRSHQELVLHNDEDELIRKPDHREEEIQRKIDKTTPPPLHMFCRVGLLQWVRKLVEESQDFRQAIESLDSYGVPPLMWAAMEGHLDVAEYLLEKGADPSITCTFHQKSGLSSYKFYRAGLSYIRLLASQDATWTGNHTALYRAAYQGRVDMVRLLLEHEADPNLLEEANFNSVHAAVISGNKEVVDEILEKSTVPSINAALKSTGITPLLYAVEAGYVEIARMLILKKASLRTSWTLTVDSVLQCAIRNGASTEMLEVLLENCSEQLINEHIDGRAAIHVATDKEDHNAIKLLKSYGADINRFTNSFREQETALHIAVKNEDIDTIETLLHAGANIEATATQSKTPLHLAAEYGFEQVVLTLVKHGANVAAEAFVVNLSQVSRKMTPLHLAVTTGRFCSGELLEAYLYTIEVLLYYDAPVNAKNWPKLQTPLDKALNRDCVEMINLLHENGGQLHRPHRRLRTKYPKLSEPAPKKPAQATREPRHSREDLQRWSSKDSLLTIKSIEDDSEDGSEKSAKSTRSHHRLSFRKHAKSVDDSPTNLGEITSTPMVEEPPPECDTQEAEDVEAKNRELSLEGVQGHDSL